MKAGFALALLAVTAFAADQNAVGNPSFEKGLENWDTAGGPEGIAIDRVVAHSGKQSVRLFGATPAPTGPSAVSASRIFATGSKITNTCR
jgi:hypothetical protein